MSVPSQILAMNLPAVEEAGLRIGSESMAQPKKYERQQLQAPVCPSEFHRVLDVMLALDRTVVELSMRLYKIPRRHQVAMREQNRRLHAAVRARLPRS